MNRAWVILGLGLSAAWSAAASPAEPEDYARYQVIVDRAPFGSTDSGGDSGPVPNFAERFTFAGSVPSPTTKELMAIIYDSQSGRSTLVAVGDQMDAVKIVKVEGKGADAQVTIQQGLEVATLRLKARDTPIPGTPAAQVALPNVLNPAPAGSGQPTAVQPRRRIPFRRATE